MKLDDALKAKTQGEIMNTLKGTGKAFFYVRRGKQPNKHIGAQAYRTVSSLH